MADANTNQIQTLTQDVRQVQATVTSVKDDVRAIREQLARIGGTVDKDSKQQARVKRQPKATISDAGKPGRTLSGVNMQQVALQIKAADRTKTYKQAMKEAKPIVKQNIKDQARVGRAKELLETGATGSALRNPIQTAKRAVLRKIFGQNIGTKLSRVLTLSGTKEKAVNQILDYQERLSGRSEKAYRVRTPQDAMREGAMGNARVVAQIGKQVPPENQTATRTEAEHVSSLKGGMPEPLKQQTAEAATETIEALKALGFKMEEIKERLAKLPTNLSVEDQIKHALGDRNKKTDRVPVKEVASEAQKIRGDKPRARLVNGTWQNVDALEQKTKAEDVESKAIADAKQQQEEQEHINKKLDTIETELKKQGTTSGGLWMLLGMVLSKIFEWGKKLIGGAIKILAKGMERLGAWLLKRLPGGFMRAIRGIAAGVGSLVKKGLGWVSRLLKSVGLEELAGLVGIGSSAVMAAGIVKSQTLVPEHEKEVQQGLDKYGLKFLGNGRFEKDGKSYWMGMEGNAKPGDTELPEALQHIVNAENLKKIDPFHAQQERDWLAKHPDEVKKYEEPQAPSAKSPVEPASATATGKSTEEDNADNLDLSSEMNLEGDTAETGAPSVVVLPTQTVPVPGPTNGGGSDNGLLALISAHNNEQSVQGYLATIFDHPATYGALSRV